METDKRNLLEYSSNNSGGSWWLKDEDWLALEAAGWKVQWIRDQEKPSWDNSGDRFLGALATNASKEFSNRREGIDEWAAITKQNPDDEGCNCCGVPHNFTWYDAEGQSHYSLVEVTCTERSWV